MSQKRDAAAAQSSKALGDTLASEASKEQAALSQAEKEAGLAADAVSNAKGALQASGDSVRQVKQDADSNAQAPEASMTLSQYVIVCSGARDSQAGRGCCCCGCGGQVAESPVCH